MGIEAEFLDSIKTILTEEGWENPHGSFGFLFGAYSAGTSPTFVEIITLSGHVAGEYVTVQIDPVRLWQECPSPFAENADWLRERVRAREWVMPPQERAPLPIFIPDDDS